MNTDGRFKNVDYATFIGQTFIHEVTQARSPTRNGSYELRILPGDPNSQVCTEFRAELHQTPASGIKCPVIVYPPAKGERADHRKGMSLRTDDDVWEVASMSAMMKMSLLGTPVTPAVMFKLMEKLAPPPSPPAPKPRTGYYAIFQSECEGDDWFATPCKLPKGWQALSHREMMDLLIKDLIAEQFVDPNPVLSDDDRRYWDDHRDETLIIVDAKTADIIETVLDSASCNDSAVTAVNWTAVRIAKQHQVASLSPE